MDQYLAFAEIDGLKIGHIRERLFNIEGGVVAGRLFFLLDYFVVPRPFFLYVIQNTLLKRSKPSIFVKAT